MTFTQFEPSQPGMNPAWMTEDGLFRIVLYPTGRYHAYFRPKKWPNFGMAVRHTFDADGIPETVNYPTLADAIADCEEFFKKFGEEPGALDTL